MKKWLKRFLFGPEQRAVRSPRRRRVLESADEARNRARAGAMRDINAKRERNGLQLLFSEEEISKLEI